MISLQNKSIILRDTTLREGLDTPHVAFTLEESLHIIRSLNRAAVPEIEMVAPSRVVQDLEMVKKVKDEGLEIKTSGLIYAHNPDCEQEIEAASRYLDRFDLLMPVSFTRRPCKREEKCHRLFQALQMSRGLQREVGVGFPHSTQTERDFLMEISEESVKRGAVRVTLYDTNGCADPFQVHDLITAVRKKSGGMIFFHGHNDLGLATANSLSAVFGGAEGLDTTINALGDRAGNASFEQVAMALHLRGIHTGVDLSQVAVLSKRVEESSGVAVSKLTPIVGEYVFSHKSPSHLEKPELFEAFDPELVGRCRRLVTS
jgi:homocitrate synthase NifV